MVRRMALGLAACVGMAAMGAAWDAPRAPNRVVEFFTPGDRYFLDTFVGGYQAVRLDGATEEELRRSRQDPDFDAQVYAVVRHGDDFVHFRTASDKTDVIIPLTSIKRVSYRVEKQFD